MPIKFSMFLAFLLLKAGAASAATPFFDRLVNEARDSASKGYSAPAVRLPDYLKNLSYDAYKGIKFRTEKGLWHGETGRFQIQFFHPGFLFQDPVRVYVAAAGQISEVQFAPELFDYGQHTFPEPIPRDLHLAGLRVLHPVSEPGKMDEVLVFLGSSYFRVLGANQDFGSSLRGLAVDTAQPGGEEFPRFTEFWIEKPGPLADQIQLFARLESPRVAGAYRFLLKPGPTTTVEIEASLFLRREVNKLGLAPVTSMFLLGENRTRYLPDFRPEVHDADGLLVATTHDRWEWRPLFNPLKVHQTSVFRDPAGFGLLQRDRDPGSYQDLEARFERRPSYWIAPEGQWGGHVELMEIPSAEERNDNVVAYWVPGKKIVPGEEFRFRYTVYAELSKPERPASALLRVQGTRLQPDKDNRTRFVLDFAGGSLEAANAEWSGTVEAARGKIENVVTQRNPNISGWRLVFDFVPEGNQPIELRAWLKHGDRVGSETWVHHFRR